MMTTVTRLATLLAANVMLCTIAACGEEADGDDWMLISARWGELGRTVR